MPHVTFIHGIANKPPQDQLPDLWRRTLPASDVAAKLAVPLAAEAAVEAVPAPAREQLYRSDEARRPWQGINTVALTLRAQSDGGWRRPSGAKASCPWPGTGWGWNAAAAWRRSKTRPATASAPASSSAGATSRRRWGNPLLLLINAHVVSDDPKVQEDKKALDRDEALVFFEALESAAGKPFRVEILWTSPPFHHAGGYGLQRLDGQPGTYDANEGIQMPRIIEAVRAAIP